MEIRLIPITFKVIRINTKTKKIAFNQKRYICVMVHFLYSSD